MIENFLLGFLGGFIIQVRNYIESFKRSQDQKNTNELYKMFDIDIATINIFDDKDTDFHEFKSIYKKIQESKLKKHEKILGKNEIFFCIFYAIVGGVMAVLINPSISFFAFYIGLTSSSFISKF